MSSGYNLKLSPDLCVQTSGKSLKEVCRICVHQMQIFSLVPIESSLLSGGRDKWTPIKLRLKPLGISNLKKNYLKKKRTLAVRRSGMIDFSGICRYVWEEFQTLITKKVTHFSKRCTPLSSPVTQKITITTWRLEVT